MSDRPTSSPVLIPRIKLQPNLGVTYGTNLGGTAGYRSSTRTTIVTEPGLIDASRSMKLAVEPSENFEWAIVKSHADKDGWNVTTTQVKRSKIGQANGTATFEIAGGTEAFTSSCDRRGSSLLAKSTERYDVKFVGGHMLSAEQRDGPFFADEAGRRARHGPSGRECRRFFFD